MCKKIIIITITIIIMNMLAFNIENSYASDISDVFTGANDFLKSGGSATVDQAELKKTSDAVYRILLVLGISIAVMVSGILGIKFMMGSVEEKAQVKDALFPFLVGCIVVFGAFTIWKIVVTVMSQL